MAPPLNRRLRPRASVSSAHGATDEHREGLGERAPRPGPRWLPAGRFLGGLLVLGALSCAGALGLRRYAMSSPRLTVKKIDIQGTRVRSADTLAAESGIKAGDNIFRVEPDACRRALLRDPWLSEVVITRDLPSTIRIVVKERQATLMVALERVYLATGEGQIFKPFEATDPQ